MEDYKPTIQVDSTHYYQLDYDTKGRFCGYWHQINEILTLNSNKILEIGVGNKFLSTHLKNRNISVYTIDIDENLNPDVVGSLLSLPFTSNSFDIIACYEVLEHLQYRYFKHALMEIHRVSSKHVIISLPDATKYYKISLKLPKIKIDKLIESPIKKRKHVFDGQHYWEIGTAGYPLRRLFQDIESVGFTIKKTYRVFENPYHRFFVLVKSE